MKLNLKLVSLTQSLLLLTLSGRLFGQESSQRTRFPYVGLMPQIGYIIPHAAELKDISRSQPYGFQAETGYILTSEKAYAQTRSFCRLGLALQHMNFGNQKELGSATGLSAYLEPYLLQSKAIQLSFRFGFGSTYLSKVYDAETNPRNVFFSSKLSFLVFLATTMRYQLSPKWKLCGSIFYNHISNGGAKMPNKGMNFPSLALGVDFLPFGENFKMPNLTKETRLPWQVYAESGLSIKNTPSDWGNFSGKSPIWNFALLAEKKVSSVHGFSVGGEFTDDGYMKRKFGFEKIDVSHQTFGALFGHTFELGKVRLTQQYAYYLFNEDPQKRKAYQRYGMFYHLSPNFYFGGTLKVHRHIADIFDIRLGYRWIQNGKNPSKQKYHNP